MTHVASEMSALMYMCLEEHEESNYVGYWKQNLWPVWQLAYIVALLEVQKVKRGESRRPSASSALSPSVCGAS